MIGKTDQNGCSAVDYSILGQPPRYSKFRINTIEIDELVESARFNYLLKLPIECCWRRCNNKQRVILYVADD